MLSIWYACTIPVYKFMQAYTYNIQYAIYIHICEHTIYMLHLDIKAMNNTHSSMPKYIYIHVSTTAKVHYSAVLTRRTARYLWRQSCGYNSAAGRRYRAASSDWSPRIPLRRWRWRAGRKRPRWWLPWCCRSRWSHRQWWLEVLCTAAILDCSSGRSSWYSLGSERVNTV